MVYVIVLAALSCFMLTSCFRGPNGQRHFPLAVCILLHADMHQLSAMCLLAVCIVTVEKPFPVLQIQRFEAFRCSPKQKLRDCRLDMQFAAFILS